MLNELFGRSDDSSPFVYLSDGGHFDNLGLYEMLRRRCTQIMVIDAGRDTDYAYYDLGHTLQRSLIDQGVIVRFVQEIKIGDHLLQPNGAYADIVYPPIMPGGLETKGRLIYLKPWLPATAPTELQAFKALKGSFPHETTTDQFFTESDFESYRLLGHYLTQTVLANAWSISDVPQGHSIEEFFNMMEAAAKPVSPENDL